ncbi:MAG: hypothetical protein KGL11_12090 [Alphaproteobacteria bacterium]|nr:hypothetical protein [Alphaproteobacteria bacterium]
MRATIEAQLASKLHRNLVHELLEAHSEAKRNFYLGGLRLSAVEGGRFCEAAFRILEYEAKGGKFTPLKKPLANTDKLILELSNLDGSKFNDSVRLHIPRSLRLVYDIRNKRDTAHLADGIDPNLQDATLVIVVLDWVLAEFIRLYHKVPANEASRIVDGIVKRVAPVVQDFDGFLKILNPKLQVSEHCTVLLYQRGENGATYDELYKWVRPKMRANLKRTLDALVDKKDYVHFDGSRYFITRLGERYVEQAGLITASQLIT